jgi:hypothetical protein
MSTPRVARKTQLRDECKWVFVSITHKDPSDSNVHLNKNELKKGIYIYIFYIVYSVNYLDRQKQDAIRP